MDLKLEAKQTQTLSQHMINFTTPASIFLSFRVARITSPVSRPSTATGMENCSMVFRISRTFSSEIRPLRALIDLGLDEF